MSAAQTWLAERLADAPEALRKRMLAAVMEVSATGRIHDQLAEAAALCLRSAMAEQAHRVCAMDLLAADALLTHACEAAAGETDELGAFAAAWTAERFEQLLPAAVS